MLTLEYTHFKTALGVAIGVALGGVVVWLLLHLRFSRRTVQLEAELKASEERIQEQRRFQEESARRLTETFNALAADALSKNNERFLQLADQNFSARLSQAESELEKRKQAVDSLVKPLSERLQQVENNAQSAYGSVKQLVESMQKSQGDLVQETRHLAQALRSPQARGRWGEMTLRRVAELAGMVEYCDFLEQQTFSSGQGRDRRPDMVVCLPNQRRIAVDAKTPLDAYLKSIETTSDDERDAALKHHARQIRERVRELSSKSYWEAMGYTPEFVVLFLPGEFFLGPALRQDPDLMQQAMGDKVVIATPSTLIALLHTVAYGWRQEQLAENARQISEMGQELHDRLSVWANHMVKLRDSLTRAVESFNRGVGSMERNVLVSARRFKEMGISSDREIPPVEPIEQTLRSISDESRTPDPDSATE